MTINIFQRRKDQCEREAMTVTHLGVPQPRQAEWQTRQKLLQEAQSLSS